MELEQTQASDNQALPNEEVTEIEPAQPGGEAAAPAAKPEPTGLEKLRAKGSVAPAAKSAAEVAADNAAKAAEVFKANIKFKAAGKEMEVPEFLRGAMTDGEKEKYLHTLLSKAHGIEMVQAKLHATREERQQVQQAYQQVMEPINYAREAYGRNDLDTVFSTLKMDPNKILQWAYEKVRMSQLPPDQRQVHEARTQAERRAWDLERQTASQGQQHLEAQSNQLGQMLDLVLERQDFSAIAQAYDTRKGKEGSFRDLVAMMGEQEFARSGKLISPMDAAKAAVDLLGEKTGAPAPQAAAAPAAAAIPAASAAPTKIVLPNAGGSKSAAPAKAKVKSLDDLRKLHQTMASS